MGGYLDGSTDGYAGTIDVLEGRSGRRLRSESERARIAAESLVPGARVSDVARRDAVTRWQIYDWRKKLASGHLALTAETASEPMFAALVVAPPSAPVTGPRDGSVREAKSCLAEENARLKARLAETEAALANAVEAQRRLESIVGELRREKFDPRSEKLAPEQFNLPLEDVEVAQGVLEAAQDRLLLGRHLR